MFQGIVQKLFFYFFDLTDVIANRSGSEPKATNFDSSNLDCFLDDSNDILPDDSNGDNDKFVLDEQRKQEENDTFVLDTKKKA